MVAYKYIVVYFFFLFAFSCKESIRDDKFDNTIPRCFYFTYGVWEKVPYQDESTGENTEYYLYSNLINNCLDTLTVPISDFGLLISPNAYFTYGDFGELRSIYTLEYVKVPPTKSIKVRICEERMKDILQLDS